MGIILFLLAFPLVVAIALLFLKTDPGRDIVVRLAAAVLAVASIAAAVMYIGVDEGFVAFEAHSEAAGYAMMAVEVVLAAVIFYLGVKHRKYIVCLLAAIQTPLLLWFELSADHEALYSQNNFYIDDLSLIMILIIGIIGSLICVYSLGYMKDFRYHHSEDPDNRPWFFFLMFVFLSAMFGIVVSNNITWLYFFWEVTTLCSFFLIGYTKKPEAVKNAFRALAMNLAGGLAFVLAIIYCGTQMHELYTYTGYIGIMDLNVIVILGSQSQMFVIPLLLLVFAGITKAAQMPFSSWLLGAMVAPTPTSALLHSSTMVKAGVFLIIKLAPALEGNIAGTTASLVGIVTFLFASLAAVSQSNAKRVLAYSTVANLGLIVACGGIGTSEAVWAAVMLVIFHAVAKSLLFLCVGTAEHNVGSRDIENFDGLFSKMPEIALCMAIGICGMFLAPFGMLLSKWAAMKAFIDSGNIIVVLLLVFGSAVTLFFWVKWLGKILAGVSGQEKMQLDIHLDEKGVLGSLSIGTVLVCLLFPLVSRFAVIPYLETIYPYGVEAALSGHNMTIMGGMAALVVLFPIVFYGRTKKRVVPVYMSGVNTGDNRHYLGAMDKEMEAGLRNWYMADWFEENRMRLIGSVLCIICIVRALAMVLAAVLGGVV